MYSVYILLCSDKSFYTGYTNDLKKRLCEHNSGNGSFYLKSRLSIKLVYREIYNIKEEAINREKQIKGWNRNKKINLIKFGHPTKINKHI